MTKLLIEKLQEKQQYGNALCISTEKNLSCTEAINSKNN